MGEGEKGGGGGNLNPVSVASSYCEYYYSSMDG